MSEFLDQDAADAGLSSAPTESTPTEGAPVIPFGEPIEEARPEGLQEIDPEVWAKMKEKVKAFAESAEKTLSGSEAPAADAPGSGPVSSGKDVDWSEYDLEFHLRHLYPQAQFRETSQGPKWVAMVDDFQSSERSFSSHGQRTQKGQGEAINVGEYLNDMLNSPDGWRLVSLLPASTGRVGVLLQRSVPYVLPDPQPLAKTTEVEAPKDGELKQMEDAALEFVREEGYEAPVPPEEPTA